MDMKKDGAITKSGDSRLAGLEMHGLWAKVTANRFAQAGERGGLVGGEA
jgi:hypothetical protein